DLEAHQKDDPIVKFEHYLRKHGETEKTLSDTRKEATEKVKRDYEQALASADPDTAEYDSHEFAPTPVTEETGVRAPKGAEKIVMVDAALHAVDEILRKHPEAL